MARQRPNNQDSPLVAGLNVNQPTAAPAGKQTVHNVHLLDRSSSMSGEKYTSAVAGINEEITLLKKDANVNYTQTIIEFDFKNIGWSYESGLRLVEHYFLTPIQNVTAFTGAGANGGTPLYEAVGKILETLLKRVPAGDKVLVKIFTDGEELHSKGLYANPNVLNSLIKEVEGKGYTVTFVGTERDTDSIVRKVGITRSNTLTHNNTASDIKRAFMVTAQATMSYSKAVADGLDVKENFYSKSVQQ